MKAVKVSYLTKACREYNGYHFGMPVDYKGFPPSNKGIVKHLLRDGLLTKVRRDRTGGKCRLSVVLITDKGRQWLKRNT